MCSVVGCVSNAGVKEDVLEGLSRLEYRGYDSSGFACFDSAARSLVVSKVVGALSGLKETLSETGLDARVGIGHTRWATHGKSTYYNAHPHVDCHDAVAVVHNGIIENYAALKESLLLKGHAVGSQTDTEVVAHLFEDELALSAKRRTAGVDTYVFLQQVVGRVVAQLEGAYALIVLLKEFPDILIAVRKGSPLCVGLDYEKSFIASDVLAFADKVKSVMFMPEQTYALVSTKSLMLCTFEGKEIVADIEPVRAHWVSSTKQGHEHFMLKEIFEQTAAIDQTLEHLSQFDLTTIAQKYNLESVERVIFLACGTSWHAGSMAEYFFQDKVGIPGQAYLASEFRYKPFVHQKNTLYVAISQSGETADTLEAVRLVRQKGYKVLVVTNVASSSLAREADYVLLTYAGFEMAVASTKAFSTQLVVLYWFAHCMAFAKHMIDQLTFTNMVYELKQAGQFMQRILDRYHYDCMYTYAPEWSVYEKMIFLGRGVAYPFAQEAALKLKEIGYVFCQAYAAGELKHGPLALVDDQMPVIVISHTDEVMYQKILSNTQEVKARGARIFSFLFTGQTELKDISDDCIELVNMGTYSSFLQLTAVMQLFVYYIAKARGCSIDRPRNLAKSVTVE